MKEIAENKPWYDGLTDKQRRFVEEYVVDCNATQAAIRAGYSKATAQEQGSRMLSNVIILAAKERLLEQMSMSALDALKQTTDIAKTRLNDYMRIVPVLKTPMVRKSLQQLIDELDAEMEFEDEFAKIAGLVKKDLEEHEAEQARRRIKGIRYALELERNPNAYRDVPGESYWTEEAVPDLVALARAKELGRIKKLTQKDGGTTIEMYPADTALKTVMEYHGKIKPGDNSTNINIFQLPDNGR